MKFRRYLLLLITLPFMGISNIAVQCQEASEDFWDARLARAIGACIAAQVCGAEIQRPESKTDEGNAAVDVPAGASAFTGQNWDYDFRKIPTLKIGLFTSTHWQTSAPRPFVHRGRIRYLGMDNVWYDRTVLSSPTGFSEISQPLVSPKPLPAMNIDSPGYKLNTVKYSHHNFGILTNGNIYEVQSFHKMTRTCNINGLPGQATYSPRASYPSLHQSGSLKIGNFPRIGSQTPNWPRTP